METTITFERGQPIDEKDRYFIVIVEIEGLPVTAEIGYIEKDFTHSEFIKNFSKFSKSAIKRVIKVTEYPDETSYLSVKNGSSK